MCFLEIICQLKFGKTSDICLILISLCLFSACQESSFDPPPKVEGDLYIRYLSDINQTEANLSFIEHTIQHTTIPKSFTRGIFFNGRKMNFRMNKVDYFFRDTISIKMPYELTFQDEFEKKHQFLINFETFFDFTVKEDKVSRSTGTTVTLNSSSIDKTDQLFLFFSDQNNTLAFTNLVEPNLNKLSIKGDSLSSLKIGPGKVYLVHKKEGVKKSNDHLIRFRIEYFSKIKNTEITL